MGDVFLLLLAGAGMACLVIYLRIRLEGISQEEDKDDNPWTWSN